MTTYTCSKCGETGLGMYGHHDSETDGFTCDKKKAEPPSSVGGIDGSESGALRAEVARIGKELKALKETFGRDGNYLKQEAEKEDAWKENLPYRGKTVWAWWAKAHAYGCMVHGVNPILGAGEGEQTADAARRVVDERDALKKERDEWHGNYRKCMRDMWDTAVAICVAAGLTAPPDPETVSDDYELPPEWRGKSSELIRSIVRERDALKKEAEEERNHYKSLQQLADEQVAALREDVKTWKDKETARYCDYAAAIGDRDALRKENEARRWECLEWQQKHDALLMGPHK